MLLESLVVDLFGSDDTTDDVLARLRSALVSELPALVEATAQARGLNLIAKVTT